MHGIEMLLLVAIVIIAFLNPQVKERITKNYTLGILGLIILIQLLGFGYRWQMIPFYLLWTIALLMSLNHSGKKKSLFLRIVKYAGLLVLLALAILLPTVLPVFQFPTPSGSYTVGTSDIQLNLERDEMITSDSNDKRSFMIKTWYPSSDAGKEMDPYVDKGGRSGFASKYGIPSSMLNYLDHVKTNVYRNVSVAESTFPVLVFSHGYNSKANGYYALLSEIASQGYIIFAVNHTYESTGSTFEDGREIIFDQSYAQRIDSGTFHVVSPAVDAINNKVPFAERHPIVREGLVNYYPGDMQKRWADDMSDIINQLSAWNKNGLFKGRLEIDKLGVFGHSRGGGAAGLTMLYDDRVQVAANVDGVQWGGIVDTTIQKPFLLLSSDWPEGHPNFNAHAYINKSSSYFYNAVLRESAHSNFMDIPLMIPVRAISTAGSIDPNTALTASNQLLTAFFDKHLKNEDVDVKASIASFPMLELEVTLGEME